MMMLEYERASTKIDNLEQMKQDIVDVIKKYVKIKDIKESAKILDLKPQEIKIDIKIIFNFSCISYPFYNKR